jgi:cytochrome c biogenesis protein CcdA
MMGQYVLLLVAVLLGIIVAGVAIDCETIGDWLWVVAGGALIVLGAAAMLAMASRSVPGNVPSRSSRIVGRVLPCDRRREGAGPFTSAVRRASSSAWAP